MSGRGDESKGERVMIERKSWSEKIGVLHIAFTRPSRVMQTANMISAVLFANEDTHILPPLTRFKVGYLLRGPLCISWSRLLGAYLHHHGRFQEYFREGSIIGTSIPLSIFGPRDCNCRNGQSLTCRIFQSPPTGTSTSASIWTDKSLNLKTSKRRS